ncbi:E2 binding [Trinorchestia longiramus]|nr:E2 binding [Trinorchestia longiramus]
MACETGGRWTDLRKLLERPGPFTPQTFEASPETLDFLQNNLKILVVGAGGLGCDLLKNLALLGFGDIHVIDMDTIDLSNLNRQFLFRKKDIGRPKAEVAAEFINSRIDTCKITPHYCKIQDFDDSWYQQFHIVVCGLDSVLARRWINGVLVSLLQYNDGELDQSSIIPLIDGGTEGFKGSARVVLPGVTACIECTLDLFPPQVAFPMCTIAHTPRLPEHCIEYVKVLLWSKDNPFGGEDCAIDGDDPQHISWIYEQSLKRSSEYNITGVTYRLTQGVIKNIIPAVASTNAVIAAACATECLKVATQVAHHMNNYCVFNDAHGIYTYTYEHERKSTCLVCSQVPQELEMSPSDTLQVLIDKLKESPQYQMSNPGIQAMVDGKTKSLYLHSPASIEQKLRPHLKMSLTDLNLSDGVQLVVADITSPNSLLFTLRLLQPMNS